MPPLPFELQVLEVVLGDVVALASQLARDLEAVVHPALDSLMKSVSAARLLGCLAFGRVLCAVFPWSRCPLLLRSSPDNGVCLLS